MQRRVLRTVLLPYSLPLYTTRSSSATLQEECFRFVFVGTLQGDTPVLIRETSRCCRGYHARDCVENLPLYSFRPRAARPARRASRFAMRCGVAEIMCPPLSTPPRPWQGVESRPKRRVNDGMSRRTARPVPNPRFAVRMIPRYVILPRHAAEPPSLPMLPSLPRLPCRQLAAA